MPSTRPDTARAGWLGGGTYAHRGLHGEAAPENSRAAFAAAIARGMGIELDVRLSRDHVAMVFHDRDLDRMTGAKGPVAAHRAEALGRLDLGSTFEGIPTLAEALALIDGRARLLVEIKSDRDGSLRRLCRAVMHDLAGYAGEVAVMSFDPRAPRWFARHAPGVVRGLVVTEADRRGLAGSWRRALALRHARADFVACDVRDLPSRFAARARRSGLPVLTWTVRSPSQRAVAADHADAPIAEAEGIRD